MVDAMITGSTKFVPLLAVVAARGRGRHLESLKADGVTTFGAQTIFAGLDALQCRVDRQYFGCVTFSIRKIHVDDHLCKRGILEITDLSGQGWIVFDFRTDERRLGFSPEYGKALFQGGFECVDLTAGEGLLHDDVLAAGATLRQA